MADRDLPPLTGVEGTPSKTPGKSALAGKVSSSRKDKGKRISELQAKFESTGDTSVVDEKEVKRGPIKKESSRRMTQHWEVIKWLQENVVATKDF